VPRFATIDDLDVRGKRVLLRADLNIPMEDGRVSDPTRIERLAPTIAELADKGARIAILSHFGRPKGKPDPKYSLRLLLPALEQALGGRRIAFAADCIGPEAKEAIDALKPGDIALLENTRFHPGEEKNDPAFAKELAALGDLFVNDAFSVSHRDHASIAGIARYLPSAAGRLMQEELEALQQVLEQPRRPLAAIVGGAKVSTKLDVLSHLLGKVDLLVIGGAMANTLLAAKGLDVGTSLFEHDMLDTARAVLAEAQAKGSHLMLPVDVVVAAELKAGIASKIVPAERVPHDAMILDIGPESVAAIGGQLRECRTLVWNGPVGAFETKPFDAGTVALAREVAERTKAGKLVSVAGGGDTVAALAQAGVVEDFTYVSTAGGAFLEWLEGRELPGVKALELAQPRTNR
jgi:phosphoglycerate kinase